VDGETRKIWNHEGKLEKNNGEEEDEKKRRAASRRSCASTLPSALGRFPPLNKKNAVGTCSRLGDAAGIGGRQHKGTTEGLTKKGQGWGGGNKTEAANPIQDGNRSEAGTVEDIETSNKPARRGE